MNGRQWQRLAAAHLVPRLPHFAVKGRLLFVSPIGELLRGFYLDSSAFRADGGYLQAFVQPMFVPATDLYFNVGLRVGGPSHFWKIDLAHPESALDRMLRAIRAEGLPFLEASRDLASYADRLDAAIRRDAPLLNPYLVEPLAYARILLGDHDRAAEVLVMLRAILAKDVADEAWAQEMSRRVVRIQAGLAADRAAARAQLATWRKETITALKLDKWSK